MFGKRIAELRIEKNLTQKELAKKLNVSSAAIGMYETEQRKLDIDKIFSFCDFFGVSTDYLLGRSQQRNIFTSFDNNNLNLTEDKKQLLNLYSKLDDRNKTSIIMMSQTLLSTQPDSNKTQQDKLSPQRGA